ncbi:MAG: carboxypeptidase-like regulatory domain-containing protein, partial [Planctomycetota bacterium]
PESAPARGGPDGHPEREETASAASRYRVSGRVLDPRGQPVPGASVELRRLPRGKRHGATGPDGRFDVFLPGALPFRVVASARGFAGTVGAWIEPCERLEIDAGDLVLLDAFPIAGRVVDTGDRPVPLAAIRIDTGADPRPEDWEVLSEAWAGLRADAAGKFRIEHVPAGWYQVTATVRYPDRIRSFTREDVRAGQTDLRFVVLPVEEPQSVHIKVRVSLPGGALLPRGRLSVQDRRGETRTLAEIRSGTADVTAEVFLPARLVVDRPAAASGKPLRCQPAFRVVEPDRAATYRIRLGAGSSLAGRVHAGGAAVATTLRAQGVLAGGGALDTLHFTDVVEFVTESAGDGSFRFEGLPPGIVELSPAPDSGYTMVRPVAARVGRHDLVVEVVEEASITGVVIPPEGVRLSSVEVQVQELGPHGGAYAWGRDPSVVVRADGRRAPFAFLGLFGRWRYRIRAWGRADSGEYLPPVEAVHQAGEEGVRIQLQRGGFGVQGVVVREDGSAVAGATVRAMPPQDTPPLLLEYDTETPPETATTTTDVKGRFRFDGLGDTDQILTVQAPGLALQQGPVRARAGGSAVRLVLSAARRLTGRVSDPEGRGLGDLHLEAWPVRRIGDHGRPAAVVWLQHDGFFDADVAPGRYRLVVWNPYSHFDSRYALSRPVATGSRQIRLQVGPGRWVEGRVRDQAGKPVRGAAVIVRGDWGFRPMWSRGHGGFKVWGLPPGGYAVRATLGELAR